MDITTTQNSFTYSPWQSISPPGHSTNNAQTITQAKEAPGTTNSYDNSNQIHKNSNINSPVDAQKNYQKESVNEEPDNTQSKNPAGEPASSEFSNSKTGELTDAEIALINELEQIDDAVRQHEMAHVAAGAGHILSGANFSYKTGPDGKRYAVGGEVTIDTSPIPGDPQATISKMRQIRNAALAPAEPSAQDRRVASTATAISTKAMSELITQRADEKIESDEEKAFGNIKKDAGNAYTKAQNISEEQQEPYFKISA
jgi:SprA-related family